MIKIHTTSRAVNISNNHVILTEKKKVASVRITKIEDENKALAPIAFRVKISSFLPLKGSNSSAKYQLAASKGDEKPIPIIKSLPISVFKKNSLSNVKISSSESEKTLIQQRITDAEGDFILSISMNTKVKFFGLTNFKSFILRIYKKESKYVGIKKVNI